ncbi:MAG: hypothetical protein WC058_08260 [Phycisphaeraceae bacterium]
MKHQRYNIDKYLQQYPGLAKWVQTCAACGARGYRPDLPENIYPHPNVGAQHLRRMFEPLELDDRGLCEQCRVHLKDQTSPTAKNPFES